MVKGRRRKGVSALSVDQGLAMLESPRKTMIVGEGGAMGAAIRAIIGL